MFTHEKGERLRDREIERDREREIPVFVDVKNPHSLSKQILWKYKIGVKQKS